MPYSRSREKRLAKLVPWPDVRYSPTGESKLFYEAKDVPFGWTDKKPSMTATKPGKILDRQTLVNELELLGVEINPTWGVAHMKKVINDRNTTR